ncbi:c-type cytochrome [Duganella callida]|uniref:C-type cytochrome n=1 Tax=Duganella callida TaxID=2561932 RepID=A0A4Y9SF17_9BURK|nr:c-type cytochrome [Duganella callida]TFW19508.1 c-type cytochrome [Duganella callida]
MRTVAALLALAVSCSACEQDRAAVPPAERSGNRYTGKALLLSYGCVACHRIRGLPELSGQSGPPLERVAYQSYLAGLLPNTQANMERWIVHPRAISPGTAMPELGVSPAEARDMAAYLYQQVPP